MPLAPVKSGMGVTLMVLSLVWAVSAKSAEDVDPRPAIPDPLTLDAALNLLDNEHPNLLTAEAGRARAEADRLDAASQTGLDARLRARLRWVEPNSNASLQQHDDHSLGLTVRKRISDFGLSEARLAASAAGDASAGFAYRDAERQQRIDVIRAFFDVLESDLLAAWHSEAMQVQFLRQEDVVESRNLRESSDLDVARADAEYQLALARSYTTQATQRSTRQVLAQALNRPRQLPSVVVRPELALLDRPVPEEVFPLIDEALANNAGLRALEARMQSAQQGLIAARAADGPVLDAEGEMGAYTRDLGGNDQMRIGLVLEVPLSTGGKTQAGIAKARAALLDAQAERGRRELALRSEVLTLWQELGLAKYHRAEAKANMMLRDMELERSRMQFEQQVKSNLGNAMANYTEAEYRAAQADHALAMAWLRLDALLGREITLAVENAPPQGDKP
ncbi:MAG: TolC family protein [Gammaproteobacteria bacterium]|nr:TolC family protein [Gammaproteobacteria bacterium]MCP5137347.1 TolC family protein [Gammaproteobacteria bacterium]